MKSSKRMLFLLAAIFLAIAGLYFRATSTHIARNQVNQILSADAASTDTTTSISNLRTFVKEHMGASVSFTLKSSYDRAVSAAQASASASNNNSQIYADAQRACSSKSDSLVQAHCNQAYLATHLTNIPAPTPVAAPLPANYEYNLVAPFWTPDLAGALLLGAAVAAALSVLLNRRKGRY